MLTLIRQHLYNNNDFSDGNGYYSKHRNHCNSQHQQRTSMQQFHISSSWLREGVFNRSGAAVANVATGDTPAVIPGSKSASVISDDVFVNRCCAVFLTVMVLMTSCCDARKIHGSYSLALTGASQRGIREVQSSPVSNVSSHPTYLVAPSNSSSLISSSSPLPKVAIPESQHEPANRAELITMLISTLQKLNVLQVADSSCFRLQKIVRKNMNSSSRLSDSQMVGVHLYFEEVHIPSADNTETGITHTISTSENVSHTVPDLHDSCVNNPMVELEKLTSSGLSAEEGQHTNGSVVVVEDDSSSAETGLSRTQIVVISTCSAIIGMFFLAAAFLRIRNYIKRSRLEQELANRPKFRSCSVALRGATQSMEQLRRDSLASKTSHQNSETTKGSNGSHTNNSSRENSSASSPRHDPDTALLLLLPRTVQPNDPSRAVQPYDPSRAVQPCNPSAPTELHASMQYIDEEESALSKKKAKILTSVTKNGTHCDSKGGNSENPFAEGNISLKGGCKTSPGSTDTSRTFRQNGQVAGNVNPSFSSGSIGYHLLSDVKMSDTEHLKHMPEHLNLVKNSQKSQENTPMSFVKTDTVDNIMGKIDLKSGSQCDKELSSNQHTTEVHQNFLQQAFGDQSGDVQAVNDRTGYHTSIEATNQLSPSSEISYFGLSQSDVSLSSITNQGNEFFGQREYHHPLDGLEVSETNNTDAKIDNNQSNISVGSLDSGAVNEMNKLNMTNQNTETVQHFQSMSPVVTLPSHVDNVYKTNEMPSVSLSCTKSQICLNHAVEPSLGVEQLLSNNIIDEKALVENVSMSISTPPVCRIDLMKSGSSNEKRLPSDEGSISPALCSLVKQTNTSADLTDEASFGAALVSVKTRSDKDICQSLQQNDNESLQDKTVFQAKKPGACETQTVLAMTSHDMLDTLTVSTVEQISC